MNVYIMYANTKLGKKDQSFIEEWMYTYKYIYNYMYNYSDDDSSASSSMLEYVVVIEVIVLQVVSNFEWREFFYLVLT